MLLYKTKNIFLLFTIFCLFFPNFCFSVVVEQGVIFQTPDTNTNIIIGNDFKFKQIDINETYIIFDNIFISANSTNEKNITLYNFTSDFIKFNISAKDNVDFVIDNVSADAYYSIYKDYTAIEKIKTNSSGYLAFKNNIENKHSFIIQLSKSQDSSCSSDLECISGNCLFGFCKPYTWECYNDSQCPGYCGTDHKCHSYSSGGSGGTKKANEIIITEKYPITRLEINLNKYVTKPDLQINILDTLPISKPSGIAYSYIKTKKSNFDNSFIKNTIIEFRVNNSWITENKITNIYLKTYDKKWIKLETKSTNKTDEHTYYRVNTKDIFDYLTIVGEKTISIPRPKFCSNGEKRCYINNLEKCVDNSWKILEKCEYGCDVKKLVCSPKQEEKKETKICDENEEKCVGDNLQRCKDNKWIIVEKESNLCITAINLNCTLEEVKEKQKMNYLLYFLIILAILLAAVGISYWNKHKLEEEKVYLPKVANEIKREKPIEIKPSIYEQKINELNQMMDYLINKSVNLKNKKLLTHSLKTKINNIAYELSLAKELTDRGSENGLKQISKTKKMINVVLNEINNTYEISTLNNMINKLTQKVNTLKTKGLLNYSLKTKIKSIVNELQISKKLSDNDSIEAPYHIQKAKQLINEVNRYYFKHQ
ncbi:MAG: hypothetical protein B6U87_02585 [Candidatus Aenigmarchaeota archaeon ex4484_52]|nr:MAG: hypothetical protein B6U87_02585 [Candidatus Aenigmarchaeota archaeon ex4484_52]